MINPSSSYSALQSRPYQFSFYHLESLNDQELLEELGERRQVEDLRPFFKRLVCTLGLARSTSLVVAAFEGERGGIATQIAVQLAATVALELGQDYCLKYRPSDDLNASLAGNLVREVFREGNQQVYQYAHRMQAGGRVGASGFVAVYDGERFSVGRVGGYEVLLWRDGELARLLPGSEEEAAQRQGGVLQRFIGANSQILVDLATVTARENDVFLVSTVPFNDNFLAYLHDILTENAAVDIAVRLMVRQALHKMLGSSPVLDHNIFLALTRIGRPLIPLTHVLER